MDATHVIVAHAEPIDRQRLVLDNAPLAHHLAAKFYRSGLDRADLHQQALLALVQAARRFEPSRGIRFVTYAYRCIRGQLLTFTGRDQQRSVHALTNVHLQPHETGDSLLDQPWREDGPDGGDYYPSEHARMLLRRVPARLALVLRLRFGIDQRCEGEPWTLTQIAEHLGVSRARAGHLVNAGMGCLDLALRRSCRSATAKAHTSAGCYSS